MEQTVFSFEDPQYLQGLNPPQKKAVEHVDGPILVLAGAGSGKTRVLTHRVAHLVLNHNVNPSQIMAVTFTNKAANEMKERLRKLLGEKADRLWMATFHSAALRILRGHADLLGYPANFAIYDDNDSKTLIKRIMKELNIDEKKNPAASFSAIIDRAKNDYVSVEEYAKRAVGVASMLGAEVYQRYQQELFKAGAMDFGDLLANTVTLFRKNQDLLDRYRERLHYILIDEFQDTNRVQYLLIKQLSEPRRNIFVVGDDDQSIYAFRGANIENILNFEKDFPGAQVVTLEQNYRSTQIILEAAYAVISQNSDRKPKKLWTDSGKGSRIVAYAGLDEEDEANFIAREINNLKINGRNYSDIAIFYRTNAQSRAIEEALLKRRIPYRIFGGLKFYERKEIKDILAYLKLIANENDSQSFLRALNTPPRGIGAQTVEKIAQKAAIDGTSMWQAACNLQYGNPKLKLFVDLITEFKQASFKIELGQLIKDIITKTGYLEKLKATKEIGGESRIENLRELVSIGTNASLSGETPESALQTFLDKVSLTASDELSMDDKKKISSTDDTAPQAISMMTLHLAKGLEYPVAFLTGMEEGLLPHYRSLLSETDIAEERRLCYVGITRAREILYLTRATMRGMFSAGGDASASSRYRVVSRFFNDIPPEILQDKSPAEPTKQEQKHWKHDEYSFRKSDSSSNWQTKKRNFDTSERYPMPPPMPEKSAMPLTLMKKIANNVTVADTQVIDIPENTPLLKDHLQDVKTGIKVLHANFGEGIIVSIDEPASHDPNKTKLKILFNGQEKEKTLLLGKARLAFAEY